MVLRIKTINGIQEVKEPPNGGWGWVITAAGFFNFGISYGFPKTMGIFFNDIKCDFGVSNTAVSWLVTFMMSLLSFCGLLLQFLKKWFDVRQIVMLGGLLSCVGMVICSFAPNIFVMYFGTMFAGLGYGLSAIPFVEQLALYFSTLTALANGVAFSGTCVFGMIYPYLNQYLLDNYDWRGSMRIMGAVSLNLATFGALIHPISTVSKRWEQNQKSLVKKTNGADSHSKALFLRKYWLALCFLCCNLLNGLTVYVPNVYVVPYALEVELMKVEGSTVLSAISIGDLVGRLLSGILISSSNFLHKNILYIPCSTVWAMCLLQIVPITIPTFAALVSYSLAVGCAFGTVSVSIFTLIAFQTAPKITPNFVSLLFACTGVALLFSGVLTGSVADSFGNFRSTFWLMLIMEGLTAMLATCFCAIAKLWNGGKMVFHPVKREIEIELQAPE